MTILSKHDLFDILEKLFGPLPKHTTKVVLTLDFSSSDPPMMSVVSLPYSEEDIVDPSCPITQRFKLEPLE